MSKPANELDANRRCGPRPVFHYLFAAVRYLFVETRGLPDAVGMVAEAARDAARDGRGTVTGTAPDDSPAGRPKPGSACGK